MLISEAFSLLFVGEQRKMFVFGLLNAKFMFSRCCGEIVRINWTWRGWVCVF
jgi:hypothetical protein